MKKKGFRWMGLTGVMAALILLAVIAVPRKAQAGGMVDPVVGINHLIENWVGYYFNDDDIMDGSICGIRNTTHTCTHCELGPVLMNHNVGGGFWSSSYTEMDRLKLMPMWTTGIHGSKAFALYCEWFLWRQANNLGVDASSLGTSLPFTYQAVSKSDYYQLGDMIKLGNVRWGVITDFNGEGVQILECDYTGTYNNYISLDWVSYDDYATAAVYRCYPRGRSPESIGWPNKTYTIRFYGGGVGGGTITDYTATYNVPFTIPANTFSSEFRTFRNWTVQRYGGSTHWHWLKTDGKFYSNVSEADKMTYGNQATMTVTSDWLEGAGDIEYFRLWANWDETSIVRLYGSTRYKTAMEVADRILQIRGASKFNAVVLATGEGFADALSGGYLACMKDAPILLTNSANASAVNKYIRDHVTAGSTIYVLGGTLVVPESCLSGLSDYTIKRLSGQTRYDTNLAILKEAWKGGTFLLVASGKDKNYPDAMAASGTGYPILLVKDSLTTAQKQFLASKGTNLHIFVLGGTSAVSTSMYNSLISYSTAIDRISGSTRYDTAVEIAKWRFGKPSRAIIAVGTNFPDGLAGGPLSFECGAPILLINGETQAHAPAKAYTDEKNISAGFVLGGQSLINTNTAYSLFRRG